MIRKYCIQTYPVSLHLISVRLQYDVRGERALQDLCIVLYSLKAAICWRSS